MSSSSRTRGRILIIDDNESVLLATRVVLEDAGYRVHTSRDVYCTDLIMKEQPELILLDVKLPGLTGDVVAGIFRDTPNLLKQSLVIFHSNLEDDELRQRALKAGVPGYIRKSEDPELFCEEIGRWIELSRQMAGTPLPGGAPQPHRFSD